MTSLAFKDGPEYSIGALVHQTIYSLYTKYGIQHNDLHCNNVMINFEIGECKLIDFGSISIDKTDKKKTLQILTIIVKYGIQIIVLVAILLMLFMNLKNILKIKLKNNN